MSSPGVTELLIVLVIVVLILGPKRLPSLGRQLGGGFREFRKSLGGGGAPTARETDDPPARDTATEPRPASAAPPAPELDADRRSV